MISQKMKNVKRSPANEIPTIPATATRSRVKYSTSPVSCSIKRMEYRQVTNPMKRKIVAMNKLNISISRQDPIENMNGSNVIVMMPPFAIT